MDASAWEHRPVAQPLGSEPVIDGPTWDDGPTEIPVRGERVGSCRMVCRTYALQAISLVGFVLTMVWIAGAG
jgi:hypothetical protein